MSWKSLFDARVFPLITDVIAYGSAVFHQKGNAASMKDLLVVVKDSREFHKLQLQSNPHHYAPWMSSSLAFMLNRLSARIFFNTGVHSKEGELYKYGVIEKSELIDDCTSWRNLYAAGRLHKPILQFQESDGVSRAIMENRVFALRLALLVNDIKCGTDFHWHSLFRTIIGFSYNGDVRMLFAENPDKIKNILATQEAELYTIYQPLLQPAMTKLNILPKVLTGLTDPSSMLQKCRRIVLKNSLGQTAKGLFTARPAVTYSYVLRKIQKRFETSSKM